MRSADYTRLSSQLPALYQDDEHSFAQVDAYLELADDLNRTYVAALEDLAFTTGPDAALVWPSDLPLTAGADALLGSLLESYDSLAAWLAYTVPSSWPSGEPGVIARRRFLGKGTRLWRRRGTPRGFVDWFSVYFGLELERSRPVLVENFKTATPTSAPEPFRATLYVPNTTHFSAHRSRLEAIDFVRWYAPAHVAVRVCFVDVDKFDAYVPFTTPAVLAPGATLNAIRDYGNTVVGHGAMLHTLACETVSVVGHDIAIHTCSSDAVATDYLGVGLLPHDD